MHFYFVFQLSLKFILTHKYNKKVYMYMNYNSKKCKMEKKLEKMEKKLEKMEKKLEKMEKKYIIDY